MSKRPTIKDLAEAAAVSVATVDRVLNSRTSVREATAQRVLKAAEAIGYHASGLIRHRVEQNFPGKTIAVLLQRDSDAFYRELARQLADAFRVPGRFTLIPDIHFMEEVTPECIVATIDKVAESADAVVLVALDDHKVQQRIENLMANGKVVISLLAPLGAVNHTGHIGHNSRMGGRSAGWTIARLGKPVGKVGILLGSHRYLNQEEAEISFVRYLREHTKLEVLPPMLNLDDDRLAAEATHQLLTSHPDLVALYNTGGGVDGVIRALRSRPDRQLTVVCNELTPASREALADNVLDMVIATPVEKLSQQVARQLHNALVSQSSYRFQPLHLPVELYIAENVGPADYLPD